MENSSSAAIRCESREESHEASRCLPHTIAALWLGVIAIGLSSLSGHAGEGAHQVPAKPTVPEPAGLERTFKPAPYRLCPDHRGGDREFGGHGPDVKATGELFLINQGKEVWVNLTLRAKEDRPDWTLAEKSMELKTWTAPEVYLVKQIETDAYSETSYHDTDHALDVPVVRRGRLVHRFEIMGDTKGNDVGACTADDVFMRVTFNEVRVRLVAESPPSESAAAESTRVPRAIAAAFRKAPKAAPIPQTRGRVQLYRVLPDGKKQLASNATMTFATIAGERRLVPVHVGSGPVGTKPKPLHIGLEPIDFDYDPSIPLPVVHSVLPEEVVPGSTVYVFGDRYEDTVHLGVEHWTEPRIFSSGQWATTIRTDEFGDYVKWKVPPTIPPGLYRVVVANRVPIKRNEQGLYSNPGSFHVRAPYPSTKYLVGVLEGLEFPNSYDSGSVGCAVRIDLQGSTGVFGEEKARFQQRNVFGDHGWLGYQYSRGPHKLTPRELQLPFFALPRTQMLDSLVVMFAGQEYDKTTDTTVWEIGGAVLGGATAWYFGDWKDIPTGVALGSELFKKWAEALGDTGNDNLGTHANTFGPEVDYGLAVPLGYPQAVAFDDQQASEDILASYRIVEVDAPQVQRVAVRIDSLDTRGLLYGYKDLYVRTRAFIGPSAEVYAAVRRIAVDPKVKASRNVLLEPVVFTWTVPEGQKAYLPFVYIEVSLWEKGGVMRTASGFGIDHMVLRRMFSRTLWPEEIFSIPEQHKVQFERRETIEPPHPYLEYVDRESSTYSVNYKIEVERY